MPWASRGKRANPTQLREGQRGVDRAREILRRFFVGESGGEDGELVVADAPGNVVPRHFREPRRAFAQHAVAGAMPDDHVDAAKTGEVGEHQHAARRRRGRHLHAARGLGEEARAVGEARDRIVHRGAMRIAEAAEKDFRAHTPQRREDRDDDQELDELRPIALRVEAASREAVEVEDEGGGGREYRKPREHVEVAARKQQRPDQDDAAVRGDGDVMHAERVEDEHHRDDRRQHAAQQHQRRLVVARARESPCRDAERRGEREEHRQVTLARDGVERRAEEERQRDRDDRDAHDRRHRRGRRGVVWGARHQGATRTV